MIFLLFIKNSETGKLKYYTKDKVFVDKLEPCAILDYYTANKLHADVSKTEHKGLKMIKILDLLPQLEDHIESILMKL